MNMRNNFHLEIPLELDKKNFPPMVKQDKILRYRLYAVIQHTGTERAGHYVAYINNRSLGWE